MRTSRPLFPVISAGLLSIALSTSLAACSSPATSQDTSTPGSTVATTASAAPQLTLTDGWVKATDEDMTSMFGVLTNGTGADIVLESATSESAGMVELHETTTDPSGSSTMRQVEGGFTVPAGGHLALEPGGDHIMLMELREPIEPGGEVAVELVTSTGETIPVTVVAKDYSGAQEDYDMHESEH
ncbi:hypothetical protein GCM10022261_09860 [Brevibacterium daeguense]|uniref:Copper chaperone PCu(A)C n=1 Tax=Brevibacterium daeguense TaxID=909936 RepID=A0ABP8EHW5_9MICO|nr:copper chaperone PCu(A)C [Brevibacterium daeguense]